MYTKNIEASPFVYLQSEVGRSGLIRPRAYLAFGYIKHADKNMEPGNIFGHCL